MKTALATLPALFLGTAAFADFTVPAGSVLQLLYLDLKHGQHDAYFNDYARPLDPVVAEHGGVWHAVFDVIGVHEGNLKPDYVSMIAWPSTEAFRTFLSDPRVQENAAIRDGAVREMKFALHDVPAPIEIDTTTKGKVYEFFGGNMASPDSPKMLGTFFQNVIPTALTYGRETLAELPPSNFDKDTFEHQVSGIAGWPTAAEFNQFVTTEVFQANIKELRDPAINDLFLINTMVSDR
ncbi:hypothetical protein ACMU_10765 [Actibacterium mucosum KCTC 23349]|uniref:DUF1330 domain-containing protein n=2 Tax=Actibacterium TaxID=1433986 RepID=A0A037ZN05_9RHOB|nr:hypothetical protein ACMU_10765 [Actibacterium mucosum KCTC 23349]